MGIPVGVVRIKNPFSIEYALISPENTSFKININLSTIEKPSTESNPCNCIRFFYVVDFRIVVWMLTILKNCPVDPSMIDVKSMTNSSGDSHFISFETP